MQEGRWYVLDYVGAVAALAVAAWLLPDVTATAAGVVVGAAILTVPVWLTEIRVEWAVPADPESEPERAFAWLILLLTSILLPLALVAVVDVSLTGFDVDGFGTYAATVVFVYALAYLPAVLLSRRLRRA